MKKEALLRLIAESGYNIGYAAKKHLATYDIVEKMPGWVSLFSAAAGICALFIPWFEQKWLAAAFIIIAIGASSIALYDKEKAKYAEAGGLLTGKLHELRMLYQKVKEQPDGLDLPDLEKRHEEIQRDALGIGVPKQIFLSDWYAHYKFFWQGQTQWMDEQLHFKLLRDKMPLGMILTFAAAILVGLWLLATRLPAVRAAVCGTLA